MLGRMSQGRRLEGYRGEEVTARAERRKKRAGVKVKVRRCREE